MPTIPKRPESSQTGQPNKSKLQVLLSVFIVGVGLSLLISYAVYQFNLRALQTHLNLLVSQTEALVENRFEHYNYGLHGARGVIVGASVEKLQRQVFEQYMGTRDLQREFAGARGFGFIRRVPVGKESQFIDQNRVDGFPSFTIRTIQPHEQDRFVIQFIYPENTNQGATGLDIGSEVNRRQAAVRAAREGQPILSAPITLVQTQGNTSQGFLALLPIYDPALSLQSPESRENAVLGWSYAPLVADEVLAELGMLKKGVQISLTDEAHSSAFYKNSNQSTSHSLYSVTTQHDIQIMGRRWVLDAHSLPSMVTLLGLWSPVWVGFIGVVLSGFLAVSTWYRFYLKRRKETPASASASINVMTFLRSPVVNKLSKVYIAVTLLFLIVLAIQRFPEQLEEKSQSLLNQVARAQDIMERRNQAHAEDLMFLASTQPIKALSNAMINPTPSSVTKVALEDWKLRLADIFKAYTISSPDVYQVRFIQADPQGLELVRVERRDQRIHVVTGTNLQYKGGRPYVVKTLALDKGQVWHSNIELNNENGALEIPYRPTFRYSTPVFDDSGIPSGIIIINMDASPLLAELKELALPDETMYATNAKGDFILHPQGSRLFGSDIGKPYTWDNEFTPSAAPFDLGRDDISVWESGENEKSKVILARSVFVPSPNNEAGKVEFSASSSLTLLYIKVFYLLGALFAVLMLFGLILAVGFYFSWSRSQRMNIENQLIVQQSNNKMFESLLELSPEALIICNTDGRVEIINSQTEKLFHYARHEILGQHINLLIPEYKQDVFQKSPIKREHLQPNTNSDDTELLGVDTYGDSFPIEVNTNPVQLEDRLLIASSVRNISRRKHIENTLREASLEAERANKAKSSFLANMSHEIRTPLNAIIGLTYLLGDENLNSSQMSLVNKVKLAGRSLLGIVNDVLDLAKIEANEVDVKIIPCDIKQLLDDLYDVFSSEAETKGLRLNFEIAQNIPQWIMTDEKLLRQILSNLLGNAIKFTESGHVLLTANLDDANESANNMCLNVNDTGIGISDEAQTRLFKPFSQANEDTNRRYGGTGLGLSIVSNMASLIDAQVGVNSTLGKGSEFWLTVPLILPTDEDIDALDIMSNALTVLIAEDDDVQRQKLVSESQALGWRVSSVASGTQLVSEVRKLINAGLPIPDVLMVDWQMPELDGLQALSLLTKEIGRKKLPAVLVISAYEQQQIAQLDVDQLVDQILQKPIGVSELFNAVNDVVVKHTGNSRRVLESTKTESIKAKWLPNINMLVVDDNEINLEVVGSILERNGANVTKASSGAIALSLLADKPDEYDIVLMDIQMPDMDGLEATKAIRESLGLPDIPVVALTAGTLMEEKKRALAAGMNDFLSKPIEPSKLIRTVRKLVELYRGKVTDVQSITDEIVSDVKDWPTISGLEQSADLLNGDLPMLVSILQRLFSEHANLEQLSKADLSALTNADKRLTLAAQVHKLRGSAGVIGAQSLNQMAGKAEIALRTHAQNTEEILISLGRNLMALRQSSLDFLTQYQVTIADEAILDSEHSETLSQSQLDEFLEMLRNNDIAALGKLKEYSANLRILIGIDEFESFQQLLYALEFAKALTLLNSKR